MIIRVVGQGGEKVFPFGTSGPWTEFRDEILSTGHQISNLDFGTKVDALISHKHSIDAIQEADKNNVPLSRRALVVWEPEIVDKKRYSKKVLQYYGIIYAPSPIWARKVSGKSFRHPQGNIERIPPIEDWIKRENKFVIIQGNKFSARKGELYSLRRKTIRKLEHQIDLWGTDWNRGLTFDTLRWSMSAINSLPKEISLGSLWGAGKKYKNYHGSVANKSEILKQYKMAIVIENSSDYVSEKLFDAVSSGCLVFYVGPSLDEFGLSKSSIVVCSESWVEISNKCREIQLTGYSKQYDMALSQNTSLYEVSDLWNNKRVLRSLAKNILKDMN